MIQTVYLDSMDAVKNMIFEQQYDPQIQRMRGSFFYRGLPDANYDLVTSLYRNCKDRCRELEAPLLENFIKYASIEDPAISDSIWEAMIVGQHHGLPTRLLDWTPSTLVALHFANTEENLDKLGKRDCAVWRIDMREFKQNLPRKYREELDRRDSFVFSVSALSRLAGSIAQYDADMGDRAIACLEPPSVDQRIVNQYSFFSVIPQGVQDLEGYLDQNTENTVKYVISRNLRWDLRDILDQFNVNERIIYPGIDGISRWLARYYFVRPK